MRLLEKPYLNYNVVKALMYQVHNPELFICQMSINYFDDLKRSVTKPLFQIDGIVVSDIN
jgi:hypothetical protein